MEKIKTKKSNKVLFVIVIILGVIFCLNLIGFVVNRIFFTHELEAVVPYGKMVEVNGQKMHFYTMGTGKKTIVLLPGFGIALPAADFGPLMRELSKQYTVICIEYPGTGFSGAAKTPRTNENYTDEIRSVLSLAGLKPPFILMPHSASGIYSEYYAAKYPKEISAIIMLDTTSTGKQVSGNPPKFLYDIGKLQQATGFTRLVLSLVPPMQKEENGYTKKEIGDYKMFAFHVLNDTIIDQSLRMLENINEVNLMDFPKEIPVLKLISSLTKKTVGDAYQEEHLKRLGAKVQSKVIDSTHFMYQTNVKDICGAADTFLGVNE